MKAAHGRKRHIQGLSTSRAKSSGAFFHFMIRGKWTNWQAFVSNRTLATALIVKEFFYCVEKEDAGRHSHTHVGIYIELPHLTPKTVANLLIDHCNRQDLRNDAEDIQKLDLGDFHWNGVTNNFKTTRAYHLGNGNKDACSPGPIWIYPENCSKHDFNKDGSLKMRDLEAKKALNVELLKEIKATDFNINDFGIKHALNPLSLLHYQKLNCDLQKAEIKQNLKTKPDNIHWPWNEEDRHVYIRVGTSKFLERLTKICSENVYLWDYSQKYQDKYLGQKYIVFPNFHLSLFGDQNISNLSFFVHLASGLGYVPHKYISSVNLHKTVVLIIISFDVPSQSMAGLLKTEDDGKKFGQLFRLVLNSTKQFLKKEKCPEIRNNCIFYHLRSFQKVLFSNVVSSENLLPIRLPSKNSKTDDTSQGSCFSPCPYKDLTKKNHLSIFLTQNNFTNNFNIFRMDDFNNFQIPPLLANQDTPSEFLPFQHSIDSTKTLNFLFSSKENLNPQVGGSRIKKLVNKPTRNDEEDQGKRRIGHERGRGQGGEGEESDGQEEIEKRRKFKKVRAQHHQDLSVQESQQPQGKLDQFLTQLLSTQNNLVQLLSQQQELQIQLLKPRFDIFNSQNTFWI